MLFLVFDMGQDRYALEADAIVEVLPLVDIKRIPGAPAGVAGLLNYRGTPVPVIDLNELALGRAATRRLSTRIVLVDYRDVAGETHLLGLLVERVLETLRREPGDFVTPGIASDAAPYLGAVTTDGAGLIQRVDVDMLLSPSVRELLFREPARV
jgi:chemotaxis-related protein WspB